MSDRVDTEAVRGQFPDHGQSHERYVLHRLCDEVDRLGAALREAVAYRWLAPVGADGSMRTGHQANHDARAVLAESGNTDRCPTCSPDEQPFGYNEGDKK